MVRQTCTPCRHCLYEPRLFCVVAERSANLPNRGVDGCIGVYKDVLIPERIPDIGSRDERATGSNEENQQVHRRSLESDAAASPAGGVDGGIQFEIAEAEAGRHQRVADL